MGKSVIIDLDFSRLNLGKVTIDDGSVDANGNIVFKDEAVKAICATTWGDGENLALAKAETVTSIPVGVFSKNTEITSFNEFEKFTSVTSLAGGWNDGAFYGTTQLKSMRLPKSITSLGGDCLAQCAAEMVVDLPNLTTSGAGPFDGSGITEIKNLGKLAVIPNKGSSAGHFFAGNCKNLVKVTIPPVCTSIGTAAFANNPAMTEVICEAVTPPTLASDSFGGTTKVAVIRVPSESVDAYKAANVWSNYADIISAI